MSDDTHSRQDQRSDEHGPGNQKSVPTDPVVTDRDSSSDAPDCAREYGGRKGPDPVRYGDWEKNGRCIDF